MLDTKARYPAWTLLENRTRPIVNPITIEPFISTGSLPRIAVLCGDKKLYVVNPATGTWRVDPTVSQMNAGITSVRASADFAGAGGVSTWGYFVAGAVWPEDGTLKNGLIISNSDPDEAELVSHANIEPNHVIMLTQPTEKSGERYLHFARSYCRRNLYHGPAALCSLRDDVAGIL